MLGDAGDALQDVRTVLVNAGNTALSNADRASLAAEIDSRYGQLLGIANTRDANGNFQFAGYQGHVGNPSLVLLRRDGQSQLVYKHAISTVMPAAPVQLFEGDKEAGEG